MDLDTRARSAAQGIHRAVEVMELSTRTDEPRKVERFDQYRDNKNRNRKIGALAVAAVLVAIVAIVAVGSARSDRTDLENTPPSPRIDPAIDWPIGWPGSSGFTVDLTTGTATPLPDGIVNRGSAYAVSPDHTQVAFSRCCNSPFPLYVANIDGTGITRITPAGYDANGVQWSPEGSQLLYQQLTPQGRPIQHGDLYTYDVATGRRTRITSLDPATATEGWWFLYPSYSPDGRSILFQLRRGTTAEVWDLWSMPVGGGERTLVQRGAGWGALTTGGQLAFAGSVSQGTFAGDALSVRNLGQPPGTATRLARGEISWVRWSPDGRLIAYADGGSIYVTEVSTGTTTNVVADGTVEWFDDHTLVVGPGG